MGCKGKVCIYYCLVGSREYDHDICERNSIFRHNYNKGLFHGEGPFPWEFDEQRVVRNWEKEVGLMIWVGCDCGEG